MEVMATLGHDGPTVPVATVHAAVELAGAR